jgi:hypothetical protein
MRCSHVNDATYHQSPLSSEVLSVLEQCTRPGAVAQMSHPARLGDLGVDFSLARRGSKS